MRRIASLANHYTVRLGGKAEYLVEVTEKTDISIAIDWAAEKKLQVIMIGDFGNVIWKAFIKLLYKAIIFVYK